MYGGPRDSERHLEYATTRQEFVYVCIEMQRRAEDELPSVGLTQKKVEPQARYTISVSVTPEAQKVADSLVSFPRPSSQQGANATM